MDSGSKSNLNSNNVMFGNANDTILDQGSLNKITSNLDNVQNKLALYGDSLGIGTASLAGLLEVYHATTIALLQITAGTDARLSFSDGSAVRWTMGNDNTGGVSNDAFFIEFGSSPSNNNEFEINSNGNVSMNSLKGTGSAFLCVDANGVLFRNRTSSCV